MRTLYNKTKVKSWIKKAHKDQSLAYGYGYITDNYALLVEEPHMRPTILEAFGTLTPECRYSSDQFQRLMSLPNNPIEVIDSQLEYVFNTKSRMRIFYNSTTGEKLAINCVYFDLLNDPTIHRFYTNDSMTMLWIVDVDNETVVGVVAPFRMQDELSHIEFKTEEEEAK
jgi:hypothetical protein